MRPLIARGLQAAGLAVTLLGLYLGIAERSMTGEIAGLVIGAAAFVAGQGLQRAVGGSR